MMASDPDNKDSDKSGASGARDLVTSSVIDKFLEVWGKDLEFKKEEINLRKEDLQHQKDFAIASLETDAKKHTEMLNAGGKESTKQKFFGGAVIVAVMVFIVTLVIQDNARLAETVVSLVGGAGLGWLGGYGYAMRKSQRDANRPGG